MLAPFFVLAGQSPTRQLALRRVVAAHVGLMIAVALIASRQKPGEGSVLFGHLLLVAGIVEGAVLVGWRLTQLPRSQALEFLLVSPLSPRRVFLAEALVGLSHLALVTLFMFCTFRGASPKRRAPAPNACRVPGPARLEPRWPAPGFSSPSIEVAASPS